MGETGTKLRLGTLGSEDSLTFSRQKMKFHEDD